MSTSQQVCQPIRPYANESVDVVPDASFLAAAPARAHSCPCSRSLPPPWPGRFCQGRIRVYVHPAALQVRLPYGLNGFCPVSDNLAAGAGTPPAPVKPMTSAVTSNFCTVGWFLPSRLERLLKGAPNSSMRACRCWCLGRVGTQIKVTCAARRAGRRLARPLSCPESPIRAAGIGVGEA